MDSIDYERFDSGLQDIEPPNGDFDDVVRYNNEVHQLCVEVSGVNELPPPASKGKNLSLILVAVVVVVGILFVLCRRKK